MAITKKDSLKIKFQLFIKITKSRKTNKEVILRYIR